MPAICEHMLSLCTCLLFNMFCVQILSPNVPKSKCLNKSPMELSLIDAYLQNWGPYNVLSRHISFNIGTVYCAVTLVMLYLGVAKK